MIVACVNGSNGNVSIVSSAGDCKQNETPMQWNVQGPQGIQGPEGPQGPQGPQGTQGLQGLPGANGVSGYQIVSQTVGFNWGSASPPELQITCPAGKRVLGGGGAGIGARTAMQISRPISETTWMVGFRADTGGSIVSESMSVFAVCANVN